MNSAIDAAVTIKIYTVSGRFAQEHVLTGTPQMVNDGNGLSYAYEYTWCDQIHSVIYYYYIEAEKSGQKTESKKSKFAVVR